MDPYQDYWKVISSLLKLLGGQFDYMVNISDGSFSPSLQLLKGYVDPY